MAKKKLTAIVKIQIPAGKATPAPPVGTALGPHGVAIMDFVKAYNAATESQVGTIIPVEISIFEDRSFTFILKTPPTPVLLVSDGDTITYYDSDLGQVNYIALDDTLAGFLARKDVRLESAPTKITDFKAEADVIRITIVERTDPAKGALTLEFVDRPLQLKFMTVKDASGNVTRVQLQGAEYGMKLDPALFVFKDPRGIRRGR